MNIRKRLYSVQRENAYPPLHPAIKTGSPLAGYCAGRPVLVGAFSRCTEYSSVVQ